MERGTNVKALIFKDKKEIILYTDGMGTSDLDSQHISIDTEWIDRIFKRFPGKAWNNTIINMNICVEYGTGDIWYSRVRTFEGSCCAEYILTSRKPRKNNRRELVNNPEDQLLGFDTVREIVFGMKKELSIDESVNVKFDYEII
jgi:hypothetical protein